VALLHDGRLARLGATADVVTPAALRETYGVDVDVVVLTRDGPHRARLRALAGTPLGLSVVAMSSPRS
jgi:ABC-type cobalamin/Fe3+-siderophores transport system ATPase subunit